MKHLRQYISQILREALKFNEDIMIFRVGSSSGDIIYVMAKVPPKNYYFQWLEFKDQYALGCARLTSPDYSCNGAMEVKFAAAHPGWGPTLYDLIMDLEEDGIINDRQSVSKSMKKMMARYKNTRDDVNKHLLDNVDDEETFPVTANTDDDCTPADSQEYRGGRNAKFPMRLFGKWSDDPGSYSYEKPTTSRAKELKKIGDKFIRKNRIGRQIVARIQQELFDDLYLR